MTLKIGGADTSKRQLWISHDNYVLKDALSLMNCFLLENGSWLDNLHLTALCSLATIATGNPVRPETHNWLYNTLTAARDKTIRKLLKDKYLILGIFLGTNIILKKSPDFLREIKPLLKKLINSLKKVDWNNDPDFPTTILYSLADTNLDLSDAKRYLIKNVDLFWKQGKRHSVIYSFLGLLQFEEGRIEIARLLRNMNILEDTDSSLSKLDLGSIAVLLLTVSEIGDKYQYVLYEVLEQHLRSEFFQIRDAVLSVLFHQLDRAVAHEKSILVGKDDAVDSLRYHPQTSDNITVEMPFKVARKLFEKPHLSDIALSMIAIKGASLETLYSLDKKIFERKCKPALKPSDYVAVERSHLLYFLIYTGLGVIAVTALSYALSKNPVVSFITAIVLTLFSIGFAKNYFSQLVSGVLHRGIEEES